MRLNPGLKRGSNEAQRNQRCHKIIQILMKMRVNPGLNGCSNKAQRNQECQQSNTNEDAFEPWAQRGLKWGSHAIR